MTDGDDPPIRNHLRAWRESKRMTQEQLAEAVGTTGAVISLLESGARQLSQKWLMRLAPVLGTTAGHLLDHHPDDMPETLIGAVMDVAPEHRAQVITILKTFARKTGTDRS